MNRILPPRRANNTAPAQKGFNGVMDNALNRVPAHQVLQLTTRILIFRVVLALIAAYGFGQLAKPESLQRAFKLYHSLSEISKSSSATASTRPRTAPD